MAYRTKKDTIEIAEKLGIDVSDMTWPEMQRAVSQALKKNDNDKLKVNTRKRNVRNSTDMTGRYSGMRVRIRPELKADAQRYLHYREMLGDELDVEEASFLGLEGGHINWNTNSDMQTTTYRVKGKTGRRVEAKSSLPRQNAGIDQIIGLHQVPVVSWKGKKGYLYKHHFYESIKAILDYFNVYYDYLDDLKKPGVIFYLTTLECIRIDVADGIIKDLTRRIREGEVSIPWQLRR